MNKSGNPACKGHRGHDPMAPGLMPRGQWGNVTTHETNDQKRNLTGLSLSK